jgi:thioredoxin
MEVTDASFAEEVLGSDVPVIVDFWAPWCRPCRAIGRVLEELADAAGERVRLVRLNVDENVGVPSRYDVLSLPTVMLFAGGSVVETVVGPQSRSRYERTFAPYVG